MNDQGTENSAKSPTRPLGFEWVLWYQALVPAAVIAIVVRLEAIFFLPYWSWLQLIPEPDAMDVPKERRKKNQALARRVAIPLLAGLALVTIWPATYGYLEIGVVSALGAGLLLWPLLLASHFQDVRSPAWLAGVVYALLPVSFVASGLTGAAVGEAIGGAGGLFEYVKNELISWLLPAIGILFANAAYSRATTKLARNRDKELYEEATAHTDT